jgi:hypothetical protein
MRRGIMETLMAMSACCNEKPWRVTFFGEKSEYHKNMFDFSTAVISSYQADMMGIREDFKELKKNYADNNKLHCDSLNENLKTLESGLIEISNSLIRWLRALLPIMMVYCMSPERYIKSSFSKIKRSIWFTIRTSH